MSQSRRTLLKRSAALLGTGTAAGLAGCSDAIDQAEEAAAGFDSGYAAFFSLADWTNQIAGEHADFENPIEVGQMGHGWEPHGDLTADVASTDAFVYLDTPEFAWAQNLASSLESDYDDVAVINGLEGMEDDFLDWDGGDDHDHDDGHDHDGDHDDDYDDHDDHGHAHVEELEIIDRSHDEVVADVHGDHWHGSLPDVEEGDYLSLGAEFTDDHGDHIHLGEDEEYQLNARVADDADAVVSIESHGDHIHVTGEEEGHTALVFQLYHDDHADWESPPLDLDVGHHDHGDEEHDHGDHDLHVEEFELIDRSHDEVAAYVDGDHWHGSLPAIAEDDYLSLGAHAETEDGDHVHFGEDEEYQLDARVADGEDDDIVSFDSHGDHVHVHGEHHGHVDVVFQIVHDDHVDWESPALEVDVGDDHADDEHGHEDDHDDHGHAHVAELDIINRDTDEVVADVHGDHWHGGLPDVEVDDYLSLGAEFVDEDGDHIHLGEDEEYQLNARVADDADDVVSIESHGDHIHVTGEEEGSTEIVFQLYHDDHADWEAPPLAVSVVPEGEAGEHDHGFFDPHVWVDPVLAKDMVDNIADAFGEIDPDNAEAYADNAEAYHAELDGIDAAFEEAVADAPRDVGVLAGHDSFQYLEERYGFDLHSPVGVSPHDEPSQNDIADTIEFVNEHDIDVVLYDRFEDPTLAEAIVENSNATEVLAVTPAEGTTHEWNEAGYGYVDQMLEVNVPAFRRALGGE